MKPDRRTWIASALTASMLLLISAPAAAQSNTARIDIKHVAAAIAANIGVSASQLPLTVQAPIDVAAAACGVAPEALAQFGQAGADCVAKTTTPALEKILMQTTRSNRQ